MIVDLRISRIGKLILFLVAFAGANAASNAASEVAHLTRIVRDVRLKAPTGPARHASINERVADGATLQTGAQSRAELTFPDQTIARLGARTTFRFRSGPLALELDQGALLLQVPGDGADAQVRTPLFAASVSGTTTVFESHQAFYKFLVLAGTARVYRPEQAGDSVLVRAGQLLIGRAKANVSDPVDFDLARFVKTCPLITDFRPLHNAGLMTADSGRQQHEKSDKVLIDTNLVMFGGGTLVSIVDPAQMDAIGKMKSAPVKKKSKQ